MVAPLAISVLLLPEHILPAPAILTVWPGDRLTVCVTVAVQPAPIGEVTGIEIVVVPTPEFSSVAVLVKLKFTGSAGALPLIE